jgi:hypothetical protein
MDFKSKLSRMAVAASLLLGLTSGCASSEAPLTQPPQTSYMKSAVGTTDEMSPLAPPAAKNVRKVGNHWLCDVNGRVMVYNEAAASWEPQQK